MALFHVIFLKQIRKMVIYHFTFLEVGRNALSDMSLHTSQQIASFVLENFCVNFYRFDRSLSLQQVVQIQISLNLCGLPRWQRFSQKFSRIHGAICCCHV